MPTFSGSYQTMERHPKKRMKLIEMVGTKDGRVKRLQISSDPAADEEWKEAADALKSAAEKRLGESRTA